MTKEQLTQSCWNMILRFFLIGVGKRKRKQVYQFLYILGAPSFLRRYFLSTYLNNSPGTVRLHQLKCPVGYVSWRGINSLDSFFFVWQSYRWFDAQGFCDDNCSPLRILTPQKWLFWEAQTPGFLQLQTLPLEGSMILRAYFFWGLEGLKDQPSGASTCW